MYFSHVIFNRISTYVLSASVLLPMLQGIIAGSLTATPVAATSLTAPPRPHTIQWTWWRHFHLVALNMRSGLTETCHVTQRQATCQLCNVKSSDCALNCQKHKIKYTSWRQEKFSWKKGTITRTAVNFVLFMRPCQWMTSQAMACWKFESNFSWRL